MISSESLSFLKKLLDTPGPSGFEAAPAKVWREHAKKFAKVSGDVAGNSLAEVNGGGKPTIMLAGHIDEIGVIVSYVDDQGFVYIAASVKNSTLKTFGVSPTAGILYVSGECVSNFPSASQVNSSAVSQPIP